MGGWQPALILSLPTEVLINVTKDTPPPLLSSLRKWQGFRSSVPGIGTKIIYISFYKSQHNKETKELKRYMENICLTNEGFSNRFLNYTDFSKKPLAD